MVVAVASEAEVAEVLVEVARTKEAIWDGRCPQVVVGATQGKSSCQIGRFLAIF